MYSNHDYHLTAFTDVKLFFIHNCTVRIEKRRTKGKHRRKKFGNDSQNSVAYKCHYCSHQNLKKETFNGHMKVICPPKEKSPKESKPQQALSRESGKSEKDVMIKDEARDTNQSASRVAAIDVPTIHSPATPPVLTSSLTTALEGSKRKRNGLGYNKASELASMSAQKDAGKATSTSSKRRKSWTSLKEIAQSSEHKNIIANLSIPFIFYMVKYWEI